MNPVRSHTNKINLLNMFTFQNSTYMYFPLGIDSVLEIKVVSADKSQVDAIVQTIEFLPGAQTS